MFLLYLFGRSIEDDQGGWGLLCSYAFCGIISSLASFVVLSSRTVSIGASGAVFGLFAVSMLANLPFDELIGDWRKLVEVAVLGEFVLRQMTSEVSMVTRGGMAGVNHVAHLAGATAGASMVLYMRSVVDRHKKQQAG